MLFDTIKCGKHANILVHDYVSKFKYFGHNIRLFNSSRRYTSSILQSLIAYFIGRKLVIYLGLDEKVTKNAPTTPFPLPMEKSYYYVV